MDKHGRKTVAEINKEYRETLVRMALAAGVTIGDLRMGRVTIVRAPNEEVEAAVRAGAARVALALPLQGH